MIRRKIYVGRNKHTRQLMVFRSESVPSEDSHGGIFTYVIGPFRTMRAAKIMALYGDNNPHLVTVAQAERRAKQERLKP